MNATLKKRRLRTLLVGALALGASSATLSGTLASFAAASPQSGAAAARLA